MATALTDIFGSEIKVYNQPRQTELQLTSFPGAHGLLAMDLGSRGKQLVVAGTLRATNTTYALALAALKAKIDIIENQQFELAADYEYKGETFQNVKFLKPRIVPENNKGYHRVAGSQVTLIARFVCSGIILV